MKIGMRIIKSIITVIVAFLISVILITIDYYIFDNNPKLTYFYTPLIAAVVGISAISNRKDKQKRLAIEVLFECFFVLILSNLVVYLSDFTNLNDILPNQEEYLGFIFVYSLLLCLGIVLILVISAILKRKDAISRVICLYIIFTCFKFPNISFKMTIISDIISCLSGIIIAYIINSFRPWRRHHKEYLFIYSVDNPDDCSLVDNKVKFELNTLIANGANVCLYSSKTPATITEIISGIDTKLPMICMSGAVLYDFKSNTYLSLINIDKDVATKFKKFCLHTQINCFTNVIKNNLYSVYVDKLDNVGELTYYDLRKNSPHANFNFGEAPLDDVIFFTVVIREHYYKDFLHNLALANLMAHLYIEDVSWEYKKAGIKDYLCLKIYSNKILGAKMLENEIFKDYKKIMLTASANDANYLNNADLGVTVIGANANLQNLAKIKSKGKYGLIKEAKRLYYRKSSY